MRTGVQRERRPAHRQQADLRGHEAVVVDGAGGIRRAQRLAADQDGGDLGERTRSRAEGDRCTAR
jgi:hypothetical protein